MELTLALRRGYLQNSLRMPDLPHPSLQVTKIGQYRQMRQFKDILDDSATSSRNRMSQMQTKLGPLLSASMFSLVAPAVCLCTSISSFNCVH